MERLGKSVVDNLCQTPYEAVERFREIPKLKVDLPPGELAIGSIPRDVNWQLPFQRQQEIYHRIWPNEASFGRAGAFVMRQQKLWLHHPDVPVNFLPQPLYIHEKVVAALEKYAKEYIKYAPEEPTWVQKNRGVPSLIGRFDVTINADGTIGICEDDFEASLWGDSHEFNQILETHITGIFQELEEEGFEPVSTELPEILATGPMVINRHGDMLDLMNSIDEAPLSYFYQHNDSGGEGASLPFVHPYNLKDNHLVVARGRRGATFINAKQAIPGIVSFGQYMDRVRGKLLIPGYLRDCKISLPAMGLGVLATWQVALDAADKMIQNGEVESVVIKKLFGARTSGVVPYKHGNREISQFSRPQAERRLSKNDGRFSNYVVMQPEYAHPTAEDLALEFRYQDNEDLAAFPFVKESDVGDIIPGREKEHKVVCRIFINHQTGKLLGGLAAGLKGHISHNDRRAAVWPVFCEGVRADRRVLPYYAVAERGENEWDVLDHQVADFAALALRKAVTT